VWYVNALRGDSFGTDSPLDLDIKGRLMEEVFSIINVRPDDEQMFSLYHKMEAERRLLAERCVHKQSQSSTVSLIVSLCVIWCGLCVLISTTASSSKVREKERVERERKEEAERLGRERWSRKRAEMLREREKEAERQREVAAAAAAARAKEMEDAGVREVERQRQMDRLEAQQCMAVPTPVSADRYQEITRILGRVYEIYCPNKMNKIDKLLSKYLVSVKPCLAKRRRKPTSQSTPTHDGCDVLWQGREEEFVAFVFDKYAVPYENMVKYRAEPEPDPPTPAETDPAPMMVPVDLQEGEEEEEVGAAVEAEDAPSGQHEGEEGHECGQGQSSAQDEAGGETSRPPRQQQKGGGSQREGVSERESTFYCTPCDARIIPHYRALLCSWRSVKPLVVARKPALPPHRTGEPLPGEEPRRTRRPTGKLSLCSAVQSVKLLTRRVWLQGGSHCGPYSAAGRSLAPV
jgi:hypothetical protein